MKVGEMNSREPQINNGFRGAARAAGYFEEEDTAEASRSRTSGETVPQTVDNAEKMSEVSSESVLARLAEPANTDDTTGAHATPVEVLAAAPFRHAEQAPVSANGFRALRRRLGLTVKPNAAELELAALGRARSTIRLGTWQRSAGILVANPKGGTGKTPLSLAIAGCLASIRGGGVVAVEVSDDPGALSVRAEGATSVGVAELLRDLHEIRGAGQLAGYVAQQTSYASVIGTVGDRAPLDGDDVRRVAQLVDTYYPLRVMDSGNVPSSAAFHGALEVTDVLVIPVLDALDALQGAMQLLRHLHQLGGRAAELARSAIVVRMHDGRPENREISAYADELITAAGVWHVVHVPYDPHIAERTTLSYESLHPATAAAVTFITEAIVTHLNTTLGKAQQHG